MVKTMNLQNKLHQKFVVDAIENSGPYLEMKAPLVVEFDTTEACMMACPGCISEDLVNHHTSFSNERIMQLAEEMVTAGVKAVIMIGGGEPLAHPMAGKFINYLGEHDVHVGITTNGVLIGRYIEQIAKYSSWTRISMDAGTSETFYKLRPGKSGVNYFDEIVQNITNLNQIKKGRVGYSYLIRTEADGCGIKSNISEIYIAAKLAKEIGCDYFEVKPSYNYAGGQAHSLVKHDKIRMEEAKEQINKIQELADDKFQIIKAITLDDSLNCVERRQVKTYHKCPMAEFRTLITPSGVYLCPYWRGKDRFRLGNVQEESFLDMWNSERRKEVIDFCDPTRVCQFHCLRDMSNNEVLDIKARGCADIVEEFDRFI